MARLVLCVLALLAAGVLSEPVPSSRSNVSQNAADPVFLQRQLDLMLLYYHLHEPNHVESCRAISMSWNLEKNIEHFSNVTAVTTFMSMLEHQWLLPRAVPFSILENEHQFEVITLYNVLMSAKDYDTFYRTAVYMRDRVNENLFAYVLSVVIVSRPDTQGIYIPRLYEVFPSFFNNGEIMTTAQRINTHGFRMIEHYPSTYQWDNNVVIRWNATIWPYHISSIMPMVYYTHDYGLNTFYYNVHLSQPRWLNSEALPFNGHRRGEWVWFLHSQLVKRYYMERLSNGLGEIPELGHDIVEDGYNSGLLYHNGIPFPVRPNHFSLDQPQFVNEIQGILDYERRVRDAIDQGYVVNHLGEHINIRVPEGIEILGRVIEANVDSPNMQYYGDFISIWKRVLGNSIQPNQQYHHFTPLVVPSVLEHYQTALRDPAFYMIWKRVLGLFQLWQESLPHYRPEDLALPQVQIQTVEVDRLVTYFEYNYLNVTSHLHMNEQEAREVNDQVSVLVQYPRLNHKVFQVRVNVTSEVAMSVNVRFFLAPKYDSSGNEIPLHVNTQNFFQIDEFVYDLPVGASVITRDSATHTGQDSEHAHQMYETVERALHGRGQFFVEHSDGLETLPQHVMLPKGRVGGMPFVLMVYISEYHAPRNVPNPASDHTVTLGLNSMIRPMTDLPLGFPVNRPLYLWQVEGVNNMYFQDVMIHHKHTPEIGVPHME